MRVDGATRSSSARPFCARTSAGIHCNLIGLAATAQCAAVVDNYGRMASIIVPSAIPPASTRAPPRRRHYPSRRRSAIDVNDLWAHQMRFSEPHRAPSAVPTKKGRQVVATHLLPLPLHKGNYAYLCGRFQKVDLAIAAMGESSRPGSHEQVKRLIDDGPQAGRSMRAREARRSQARYWRASVVRPIPPSLDRARSPPRACSPRFYAQSRTSDWVAVGNVTSFRVTWPQTGLWNFAKPLAGKRVARAAPGVWLTCGLARRALANGARPADVSFGGDGDFSSNPVRHLVDRPRTQIPMLLHVHNNRADHHEYMYFLAAARTAAASRRRLGPLLVSAHRFTPWSRGMGAYGDGPVVDPNEPRGALKLAISSVKSGHPRGRRRHRIRG